MFIYSYSCWIRDHTAVPLMVDQEGVDMIQDQVFMMMGATRSSKTLVSYQNTRWYHNAEEMDLDLHCQENLKPHMVTTYHINSGKFEI
jgi:hypothetical protein